MPCGAKKNLGRVEKFEKTRFFQYFYWRILEIYWNLKFWKKLSHKNAIKMIWGVLFLLPSRKISQTVAPLIKIVALFWQDFGATFWRFLAQKVAPSDSKHLASLKKARKKSSWSKAFSFLEIENKIKVSQEKYSFALRTRDYQSKSSGSHSNPFAWKVGDRNKKSRIKASSWNKNHWISKILS